MQIEEGDIIERKKCDIDTCNRKYKIKTIGKCGRVGLKALGDGVDLFCCLFKNWRTFDLYRNFIYMGQAEHWRSIAGKSFKSLKVLKKG